MAGMSEEGFRLFYESTARRLRSYLWRMCGDPAVADDLMQEAFLRLLRTELPEIDEPGRRRYLFRIGTNLVRDRFRRSWRRPESLADVAEAPGSAGGQEASLLRSDLDRVLLRLNPRDREMLWLAYVEGARHEEIAQIVGLKPSSVRTMLFRARQRLARLLRLAGLGPSGVQGGER
jgi:RNA polymerase sigma-70 factor (ECF subfamily)